MASFQAVWPVQDAKARFSELLDTCLCDGPQTISRRGITEAVIVPLDQWRQWSARELTLKDLLLADGARFYIDLPERGQGNHRDAEAA